MIAECDILLQPDTVSVVVGRISWDEMRTLQVKELVGGGVKPVKVMGDRGIEIKHTLQRVFVTNQADGRLEGRLNVVMQNHNDTAVFIKEGAEIGGYWPQCAQAEDRYDLASMEGMNWGWVWA